MLVFLFFTIYKENSVDMNIKFEQDKTYIITTIGKTGSELRYRCKYMDNDLLRLILKKFQYGIEGKKESFGNSGVYIMVDSDIYNNIKEFIENYYKRNKINIPLANKMDIIHSSNEDVMNWVNRLSELAGIDKLTALEVAKGRIAFHRERLKYQWLMQKLKNKNKHTDMYKKDTGLIQKYLKFSPLYEIKDKNSAKQIYNDYIMHVKTDYEELLKINQKLAKEGKIDYSEIRDLARKNAKFVNEVYVMAMCNEGIKFIINESNKLIKQKKLINEVVNKVMSKYLLK